jgi:hypothetical protein
MAFLDLAEGILESFAEQQDRVPFSLLVFAGNKKNQTLRIVAPNAAYYQSAKAYGRCPDCHAPAEPGKTHCRVHLDRRAGYVRDLKARYTDAGNCRCSRPRDREGKLCSICCEQARIRAAKNYVPKPKVPRKPKNVKVRTEYRLRYKAEGRCNRCPNQAKPGRTRCEACTLKARKPKQ